MRGKRKDCIIYFCTNDRWKKARRRQGHKNEETWKDNRREEREPHWIRESTLFKYVQHFEPGGPQ